MYRFEVHYSKDKGKNSASANRYKTHFKILYTTQIIVILHNIYIYCIYIQCIYIRH